MGFNINKFIEHLISEHNKCHQQKIANIYVRPDGKLATRTPEEVEAMKRNKNRKTIILRNKR